MTPDLKAKLDALVASDAVVLFMKGNRSFPQCGFSSSVVNILNGYVPTYATVNILADEAVRSGMKEYSEWPTFPQLYIRGEFVGGADIVRAMHETGELKAKLGDLAKPVAAPTISVTPAAAQELKAAMADAGADDVIHIAIGSNWQHQLDVGPREAGKVNVAASGLSFQLDAGSAAKANGLVIDFVTLGGNQGFSLDNPNRPATVKQLGPQELQALLSAGTIKYLFDVRTRDEHRTAKIAAARLLEDSAAELANLPKSTPIVFMCHHGGRSQAAAERALSQGFTTVYNLAGGIDAWSLMVDKSVPRY